MNHIFAVRTVTDCVSQGLFFPSYPRTNHNSSRPDVMRRCTLRMCSEYGLLAMLTICTSAFLKPFCELHFATVLKAHFSHQFSHGFIHFLGACNRLCGEAALAMVQTNNRLNDGNNAAKL